MATNEPPRNLAASEPASTGVATIAGPVWNLGDLYVGAEDPRIETDLGASDRAAGELEAEYKGRLAEVGGDGLAAMIERYEAIEDGIGRVSSFAQLLFAANRDDPDRSAGSSRASRSGSTTIGTKLLFVTLELNKLEDAPLADDDRRLRAARPLPALARHGAQLPPAPARRRDRARAAREVRHRPQRLGPPVRRDHGGLALPARRQGADQRRDLRPALGQGPRGARAGRAAISGVLEKNVRLFGRITNTLVKDKQIEDGWRKFERPISLAQSRQPGRGRGRGRADRRRPRRLPAHLASLLRAQGALAGPRAARVLGSQRAAARGHRHAPALGRRQGRRARRLPELLADAGRHRRAASSRAAGSTPSCGPARTAAPSATRPCPACIPTC